MGCVWRGSEEAGVHSRAHGGSEFVAVLSANNFDYDGGSSGSALSFQHCRCHLLLRCLRLQSSRKSPSSGFLIEFLIQTCFGTFVWLLKMCGI